jgi:hypothetical protein
MLGKPLSIAAVLAALTLAPLAVAPPAAATDPRPWPDPWSGYMAPPAWAFRNIPFVPYGGPMAGPCAGIGVTWMVRATGYAAGFMDLDAGQQKALAALEDTAKTQSGRLRELCSDAQDWKGTAPERMKRVQEALDAARDAMRELRPRFEDFYQTLTPRQKEIVDDMVAGRGPGFGRWWEDY